MVIMRKIRSDSCSFSYPMMKKIIICVALLGMFAHGTAAIPEVKKDVLNVNNRPAKAERLFRSDAGEKKIKEVAGLLTNLRLAWMFVNC